jgi:hypothetical protein
VNNDTQLSSAESSIDVIPNQRLETYDAPLVQTHPLLLVTLGGSPGLGDSGDPENQRVSGV